LLPEPSSSQKDQEEQFDGLNQRLLPTQINLLSWVLVSNHKIKLTN